MEEKEFNPEDLDNLYGGMPFGAVEEKTEENESILRQQRIADLKRDREIITNSPLFNNSHSNTQSGRSK